MQRSRSIRHRYRQLCLKLTCRTELGKSVAELHCIAGHAPSVFIWAFGRLLRRPENRRILLVISDSSPVDVNTIIAEGREYLESHLKYVTDWIESGSDVQLMAIGIVHDVNRYYRDAVSIASVDQLGSVLLEKLTRVMG